MGDKQHTGNCCSTARVFTSKTPKQAGNTPTTRDFHQQLRFTQQIKTNGLKSLKVQKLSSS